ncbi:hypothetical protein BH23BAC4_BH23BAC4_02670 [soil metagenome]
MPRPFVMKALFFAVVPPRAGLLATALVLFVCVGLASQSIAQTQNGTAAADFLNIPIGARAIGLGGAFVALADDASAIYWNPAGLARQDMRQFSAEHASWLVGVDLNYASLMLPTTFGTVAVGITSMSVPEMEVTTAEMQDGTGETFSAGSFAVTMAYARNLTDQFSLGANVKYIREHVASSSATGIAVDIGTLFTTPFYGVRLGAAIANFGTPMRMTGPELLVPIDIDPNNAGNNNNVRGELQTDQFDLPRIMRVGIAGEPYQSEGTRVTLAIDALSPSAGGQHVNVGAEVGLLGDLVQLRGGVNELFLADSPRSFTLGAGLRYTFGNLNIAADYAYEAFQYFDGVNRFTVSVRF